MDLFTDRLLDAMAAKGAPTCVGLDPVFEKLPPAVQNQPPLKAIEAFCLGVIDAIAEIIPAVKPQSACFERYGSAGVAVLEQVIDRAHQRGLIVITDAKRGDIGPSASHYAAGLLRGPHAGDALTLSAYLGVDGVEPFLDVAAEEGRGLFALVRTSNPGSDAIQALPLADGRTVAEAVGDALAELGSRHVGRRGYSLLGAVVGATKPDDARRLRQRLPQQLFLVPGFGAQGGGAEDVRACFKPDGTGAIITASRSVIYAFQQNGTPAKLWQQAVAAAAVDLNQQIRSILEGSDAPASN